jgi:hypothetical protein
LEQKRLIAALATLSLRGKSDSAEGPIRATAMDEKQERRHRLPAAEAPDDV